MSETQQTGAGDADTRQRYLVGKVVSDRMDKTIVVLIERRTQHPLYGKYVRRSTKLKAHDPDNTCNIGDVVEIGEVRPISRNKSWALTRVLESVEDADSVAQAGQQQ